MKNITVSLPDDAYREARIRAVERDTSVSALVREFLMSLAEEGNEFDRRKRLQDETIASIREFRASDRLTRDEIHDRDSVR